MSLHTSARLRGRRRRAVAKASGGSSRKRPVDGRHQQLVEAVFGRADCGGDGGEDVAAAAGHRLQPALDRLVHLAELRPVRAPPDTPS